MKINKSGATFSSIVGIGAKIKKMMDETGQEYLFLNRGINAVCPIDLSKVIPLIDFNSTNIQVYPPNKGTVGLRDAINNDYFDGNSSVENISITSGGMTAIDLPIQILDLDTVYFSKYYWGSYAKICQVRGVNWATFHNLTDFINDVKVIRNSVDGADKKIAVLLCDPNNPVGNKLDDAFMLEAIKELNALNVIVFFDSPYRKIFNDHTDTIYVALLKLENVIITESFSKSMGLSGQRIGFIHSTNKDFNEELNIRLLYGFNGVNAFAQELITVLLTTEEGKKAVSDFKKNTVEGLQKNIQYLKEHNLLVEKLYQNSTPVGIFTVINISEEELLRHKIGSVGMVYFTNEKTEEVTQWSRICVSVPHQKFKSFFDKMLMH